VADLSGRRYGELLLVTSGEAGAQATVYNSFPLNDCPAELWSALDPQAIAAENGAATALLNGPRYWLMNAIEKEPQAPQITKTFGGIEMMQQATVLLSSMNPAPFTVNRVSRNTVFVFNAREEIYELIDPEGRRWVMQTLSQIVEPRPEARRPARVGQPAGAAGWVDLPAAAAHQRAAGGHQKSGRPSAAGQSDQQLLARDRLTPSPYRYWPRFDSVSMARDALEDLPVTRVRM
jgi:hypothetical protein